MITVNQCKLNMVSNNSFADQKSIHLQFKKNLEPASMRKATTRAIGILGAVYEKSTLAKSHSQRVQSINSARTKQTLRSSQQLRSYWVLAIFLVNDRLF